MKLTKVQQDLVVNQLVRTLDFHKRRITNASRSQANFDYVIKEELNELQAEIDAIVSASVSDDPYGAGWDGSTTVAPSQNAVYDKVQTLLGSSAYTPSNVTTDRSYDANATTIDELADVLGTLIADLQGKGILS